MVRVLAVVGLILSASFASADEKYVIKAEPGKIVPKGSTVIFTDAGGTNPDARAASADNTITDFSKGIELRNKAYDVWLKPKNGKAILVSAKWTPKADATIDLPTLVGILYVRGDDLPRAESIVVTLLKDAGPDEKGHVAIQVASDYKEDMLVPVGMYEVWVKPANGARPQRIVDNVRVQNGRMTEVPER